jgi:hypothetical protein
LGDKWLIPAALCATPHRGQHLRPGEAGSAMFWAGSDSISWRVALVDMDLVGEACRVSARRPTYFLLLRQKKVSKEKASRSPGRCAVPCAARVERGRAELAFGSNNARPDPLATALLSPATRRDAGAGSDTTSPENVSSVQNASDLAPLIRQRCLPGGDAPKARRGGIPSLAVMRRRVAQGLADQGGRCLSAASLGRPRLDRATQRTRRAAHSARLSFGYFSLAKQRKVPRQPGRDPACIA